jgi:truncated hemoglobin YjbI
MNSKPAALCHTISRQQVAEVVAHFYRKVLADAMLAPHFAQILDWPRHEEFITDFWWGVMGGEVAEPRPGAMLKGHQGLGITAAAMQRWLKLFSQSIDELLPPTEASQWQAMARSIATMMGEHDLIKDEDNGKGIT